MRQRSEYRNLVAVVQQAIGDALDNPKLSPEAARKEAAERAVKIVLASIGALK